MKLQIPSYQALRDVPKDVKEMWKYFSQTMNFLQSFVQNGISLEDNINHMLYSGPAFSGVVTTIKHSLKRKPKLAIICEGRVDFLQVIGSDSSTITVKARLLNTTGDAEKKDTSTKRIYTPSATFFTKNDRVRIDGVDNTVAAVATDGLSLLLDKDVTGSISHNVELYIDNVKILIL
jgi:hypothetical protein